MRGSAIGVAGGLLLVVVVTTVACPPAREFRFELRDCGLAVTMPREPRAAIRLLRTSGHSLHFRWYALEVPRDPFRSQNYRNFLEVGCAPLPASLESDQGRAEVEQGLVEELGGTQTARRVIHRNGYDATELEVRRQRLTYINRVVFTDGRLVQLRAGKSGNRFLQGREVDFLESLEILPQ